MGRIKNKSFTLIELIVAVGVIGLILPAIFNIFFSMIRQQLVLISYQEMRRQGDSALINIKNILRNRAAYITDSTYTITDICPLITTPTPSLSPNLYINDIEGNSIHFYQKTIANVDTIASDSAFKPYNLTSNVVTISGLGFSCYRPSDFSPAIVSTTFTIHKSTIFKEITLPYTFKVKLGNY